MKELTGAGYLLTGTVQINGRALKISNSGNMEWIRKMRREIPAGHFFDVDETKSGNIMLAGSNNIDSNGYDDVCL